MSDRWNEIKAALFAAKSRGYSMSRIAREIDTSGANLSALIQRGGTTSPYYKKLTDWLTKNNFLGDSLDVAAALDHRGGNQFKNPAIQQIFDIDQEISEIRQRLVLLSTQKMNLLKEIDNLPPNSN